MQRMYNVIWIRDDKGTRGQHNVTPLTHAEACAFLSKLTGTLGAAIFSKKSNQPTEGETPCSGYFC